MKEKTIKKDIKKETVKKESFFKKGQRKIKTFWTEHKMEIVLAGAGIGSAVLGVVGFNNLANHLDPEKNPELRDEYEPFLMTDQNGQEHRLFKWNGSKDGNPDCDMFFPDNEIGWSHEIDWDNL